MQGPFFVFVEVRIQVESRPLQNTEMLVSMSYGQYPIAAWVDGCRVQMRKVHANNPSVITLRKTEAVCVTTLSPLWHPDIGQHYSLREGTRGSTNSKRRCDTVLGKCVKRTSDLQDVSRAWRSVNSENPGRVRVTASSRPVMQNRYISIAIILTILSTLVGKSY